MGVLSISNNCCGGYMKRCAWSMKLRHWRLLLLPPPRVEGPWQWAQKTLPLRRSSRLHGSQFFPYPISDTHVRAQSLQDCSIQCQGVTRVLYFHKWLTCALVSCTSLPSLPSATSSCSSPPLVQGAWTHQTYSLPPASEHLLLSAWPALLPHVDLTCSIFFFRPLL